MKAVLIMRQSISSRGRSRYPEPDWGSILEYEMSPSLSPSPSPIRVSDADIGPLEIDAVVSCLKSGSLTQGSRVIDFEGALAGAVGARYAISCSSGTSALHLSMIACGVRPGSRVAVPAMTYVATVNAIRYCGATPVFCDVDPDTWCIDISDLNRAPDFIVPVHLYGMVADVDSIRRNLPTCTIIEDAAQALGASVGGVPAGRLGRAAVISFYGSKIITTGEGGAVITDDPDIDSVCRLYRGQGVNPSTDLLRRYFHTVVGYNYRMTDICAAVGLAQLRRLGEFLSARARVAAQYRAMLSGHPDITLQKVPANSVPSNWMVAALIPDRDRVMSVLRDRGVETRPAFIPITDLPMYNRPTPPVSSHIGKYGINLPTHTKMRESDVSRVVEELIRAL